MDNSSLSLTPIICTVSVLFGSVHRDFNNHNHFCFAGEDLLLKILLIWAVILTTNCTEATHLCCTNHNRG